jgi:hypothetical protein
LVAINPVAAAGALVGVLGTATNATINSVSSAMQLSTTVVGVLVTMSGAVVGYVLVDSSKKKKTKNRRSK